MNLGQIRCPTSGIDFKNKVLSASFLRRTSSEHYELCNFVTPNRRLYRSHVKVSVNSYVKNYNREVQKRSKQVVALINITQTSNLISQRENLEKNWAREEEKDISSDKHGGVVKPTQPGSLFVFGLGYVARGLCTQLQAQGWRIMGTSKTHDKQKALQEEGFETFIFDSDHMTLGIGKKGMDALRSATHILVAFSPSSPEGYCPIMWILGREFKHLSRSLQWIGYLSSTSVYGNYDGAWVDEESELKAEKGNGAARAVSENAWLYFGDVTGLPVHVFRLAGVYGPGRNAIEAAKSVGTGKRDGKKYTSRCHVHDICKVLMASMANPEHGEIYNVADDDPTNRETVIRYVQDELIGETPQNNGEAQTRSKTGVIDEKRVSNSKVKEDLGVALDFPSYKEGLQAIYEGNNTPFE